MRARVCVFAFVTDVHVSRMRAREARSVFLGPGGLMTDTAAQADGIRGVEGGEGLWIPRARAANQVSPRERCVVARLNEFQEAEHANEFIIPGPGLK